MNTFHLALALYTTGGARASRTQLAQRQNRVRSLYWTPAYVAPERIGRSNVLGPSTDLYSVGCLAIYWAAVRL